MLDATLGSQLRTYLERLVHDIELVASLDDSGAASEMRSLIEEVARLSPRVHVRLDGVDARRPSFQITRAGADMGVRFAAVPMGHEFTSLVLAMLQAGGHPPKVAPELIDRIRTFAPEGDGVLEFETWMSLTCHNCPDVVQALNLMAVLNPRIRHVAIDGGLFQEEVEARQIMAVPAVFLGGELFASGRMSLEEILAKVDTGAAARDAERLAEEAPFDVLVVGGGPAGAAAAVYAARKGIRTGLVAERFGGQTLDTLGIENFISVRETQGPRFAADLEAHVRAYDVALMKGQRAEALAPATQPGGHASVRLGNGAELRARAIVLAPGARWRNVGVPGEQEYKTRGVAYCPHCDGPLFKGKKVAVIGGGNSGVEAAIDLAGIVEHVTLIEFAEQLKADAVLVDKLRSLPNVTLHLNAQTLEIHGDGQKVTGLSFRDRASAAVHHVELAGVFVQIGLVPNTEWLKGTLELNRHGEIVVDARGATSLPGVFAAGDATTVPYKQIIVASGEGSKAALSAFDHLIRTPAAAA
ncbi:MAG TPA: alkyl hydroperoxide reductase subunit F [Burkholderiaceae bacterium]|nr:alkyl hydroperoxide reductase subunit F [Burkholderiaceae bacterium]